MISLETAVQMLLDAGYSIEDVSQEVARIRAVAEREAVARVAEAATRMGEQDPAGGDDHEADGVGATAA
ncbi:hypothetical protein ACWDBW_44220 [Streptomyces sp. NPDC001107]